MDTIITQEYLKSVIKYCPKTGVFTWIRNNRRRKAGRMAGHRSLVGYLVIGIDGRKYQAHRLAWIYTYGSIPDNMYIDHINLDKTDNRLCNLRVATQAQNQYNSKARNKLGIKGVEINKGKFRAKATYKGKFYCLGNFNKITEAEAAYKQFAKRNHGDFYKEPKG